jgi:anti-sigma B factor antagonist
MTLTINRQDGERFVILDIQGPMTQGGEENPLTTMTRQVIAEGRKQIALDLRQVTRVDSHGIRDLVMAFSALGGAQGRMVLVGPSESLREKLGTMRITNLFVIRDTIEEALPLLFEEPSHASRL